VLHDIFPFPPLLRLKKFRCWFWLVLVWFWSGSFWVMFQPSLFFLLFLTKCMVGKFELSGFHLTLFSPYFLCSFECPEWEFNLHSPLSKYVGFRYPQAHTKKNFKSLNFPNLVRLVPFSCKISPETVWFWFWLWDCSSPLLFFLLRKFK